MFATTELGAGSRILGGGHFSVCVCVLVRDASGQKTRQNSTCFEAGRRRLVRVDSREMSRQQQQVRTAALDGCIKSPQSPPARPKYALTICGPSFQIGLQAIVVVVVFCSAQT